MAWEGGDLQGYIMMSICLLSLGVKYSVLSSNKEEALSLSYDMELACLACMDTDLCP